MTEFDTLTIDTAEMPQEADVQTADALESCDGGVPAPLFCAPVLDRIRTSD